MGFRRKVRSQKKSIDWISQSCPSCYRVRKLNGAPVDLWIDLKRVRLCGWLSPRLADEFIRECPEQVPAPGIMALQALTRRAQRAEHANPPGLLIGRQIVTSVQHHQAALFKRGERARWRFGNFLHPGQILGDVYSRLLVLQQAN